MHSLAYWWRGSLNQRAGSIVGLAALVAGSLGMASALGLGWAPSLDPAWSAAAAVTGTMLAAGAAVGARAARLVNSATGVAYVSLGVLASILGDGPPSAAASVSLGAGAVLGILALRDGVLTRHTVVITEEPPVFEAPFEEVLPEPVPPRRDVDDPIDELSRDELYDIARELDIPGRSKMTKAQLAAAISRYEARAA